MLDSLSHVQQVAPPDHLVQRVEAELRHVLAHLLGDEAEEVDDVVRATLELLAQLRVLRRNADGACIQVADAHHHAAQHDQRRSSESELLRPQQRSNHHVAARLHLPIRLHHDAVAQVVQHQRLLRLRQP